MHGMAQLVGQRAEAEQIASSIAHHDERMVPGEPDENCASILPCVGVHVYPAFFQAAAPQRR